MINLGHSIYSYQFQKCSMDRGVPNLYSVQNEIIPLTLASGRVVELRDIMDDTPLE